ncbi:MAG: RagB/SusD family nutrient uptake outer membrane protein [Bacteroidales bacterium]|nr:RagB/SusD family nutrient uptake outer membrane protein [Bacteroidales bacterium]MCR5018623.1 RagB/SusD family nutrient uptake outer membrane protein [Bacteroidales bacterium]
MKKYIIYLAAALALVSCDKLLNQYPHNAVSSDNLTEEDAELLMVGAYNIAQYKPTFNGWAMFDIIGGDIIRPGATSTNTPALVVQGAIAPDNSMVSSPWNGYYAGLYQINNFINSVEKIPDSARKTEMLGVGHFFRGLYYYNLVTRWRSVPIVTGPITEDVGQDSEADCWKFVEDEFKLAAQMAPDFSNKNYVSKDAAKALLARTYLATGKKAEAAALAEELITCGRFALADFSDIFRGKYNREEIFTFANLLEEGSYNIGSYYYTKESPVGGSYTFCPTQEAMDMFQHIDKRRTVSVDIQGSNNVVNKYCQGDAGHDPIYITRLAEMYLISAECKGLALGIDRLNELRRFRGLPNVAPATEAAFQDAVLNERRLELFGEGFRWFDLVRTGKYEQVVGVDTKFTVFPIPSRELTLNKLLKQNPLWVATPAGE